MCENPITWVAVKQDWEGKTNVTIRRDRHEKITDNIPVYRPGKASQDRVLRQIENQAIDHRISLGLVTGKFSVLLHLNLPPKRAPMINFDG